VSPFFSKKKTRADYLEKKKKKIVGLGMQAASTIAQGPFFGSLSTWGQPSLHVMPFSPSFYFFSGFFYNLIIHNRAFFHFLDWFFSQFDPFQLAFFPFFQIDHSKLGFF
jgi:hypothetical protein